jgi:hypothetical protein
VEVYQETRREKLEAGGKSKSKENRKREGERKDNDQRCVYDSCAARSMFYCAACKRSLEHYEVCM